MPSASTDTENPNVAYLVPTEVQQYPDEAPSPHAPNSPWATARKSATEVELKVPPHK